MKKFALNVVALLVAVCLAVYLLPPVRQRVAPYLPAALARLLPATASTDAAASADAGVGKAGGDTAKTGSGSGGGRKAGGGPISVLVASAQATSMPLIERTYGTVQSPAIATINARIASQVTEVHVKDGQMVKAGDLLLVLDDKLLQAQLAKDQAQLAKDKALAVSAELDAQRAAQLAQRQAGPQQSADQAKAAAQAAQATVQSDQAAIQSDQVQLGFTRISAPISGRLGAVAVNVGDLVSAAGTTQGLMSITEMQPLKVAFRLPDRVLGPVRRSLDQGTAVKVRLKRSGTDTVLGEGSLDFIDSSIDTTSGTIAMSATLPNDELKLWPGQFGDVEVEYGMLDKVVVVPSVAVQAGQSGPFVWLVKPDNTVDARVVKVARTEADKTAVSDGLAAGDSVVVEGQLRLKPGAAVMVGGGAGKSAGGGDQNAVPGATGAGKPKTKPAGDTTQASQ